MESAPIPCRRIGPVFELTGGVGQSIGFSFLPKTVSNDQSLMLWIVPDMWVRRNFSGSLLATLAIIPRKSSEPPENERSVEDFFRRLA
jgi:hypothetical protein